MPKFRKKASKSLGNVLMNTFFPPRYAPPPSRVRTQLPGHSGNPHDQLAPPMPHDPYAWGRSA